MNVTHPSKLLPDIDTHTDDSYGIVARVDFTRLFYEFVAGTRDVQAGFDVADGENADGENVQRVEWIAQVYVANFARHSGPVLLLPIMRGWDLLVRLLQQQKAEGMGDALFHTSEDWVLAVLEQELAALPRRDGCDLLSRLVDLLALGFGEALDLSQLAL